MPPIAVRGPDRKEFLQSVGLLAVKKSTVSDISCLCNKFHPCLNEGKPKALGNGSASFADAVEWHPKLSLFKVAFRLPHCNSIALTHCS